MKNYRTAVIGTGFIGVAHVEALRRLGNVDVVAICDTYNCKEKAKQIFVEKAYSDYKTMIKNENLDFIHICTPNNTHYEIASYALNNGVNVLLEKPMTFSTKEAIDLYQLSLEKNLKCVVNFHNRYYPATAFLKDYIKEGNIGEINSVHGMYIQDWLLYDTDYSWRLNSKESGITRAVADIGSHWIDLVEYITGLKVVEVFADFKTVHPQRKKPAGETLAFSDTKNDNYELVNIDTEDIANVMFRFNNGAIGTTTFSQVFAGKQNKIDVYIAGSKASGTWKVENQSDVIIGHRGKPEERITKDQILMSNVKTLFDYPAGHSEGFPDAFKQLFKQLYSDTENPLYATFYDGLRQMIINDKIYESAQKGSWIKIDEVEQ